MNARGAHPDHFFGAADHALFLFRAGASSAFLGVMARGFAARGLGDAAQGVDHIRLRIAGHLPAHNPTCRTVTQRVNDDICRACRRGYASQEAG